MKIKLKNKQTGEILEIEEKEFTSYYKIYYEELREELSK